MPIAIVLSFPKKEPRGVDPANFLRKLVSELVLEDLVEQEMQAFSAAALPGADEVPFLRIATVDEKLEEAVVSGAAVSKLIAGEGGVPSPDHPLAGRRSFEDLFRKSSVTAKEFRFEFLTPTCFHHADLDVPLPLTRPLFSGLYRRWKHSHTRIALHEDVVDAAERHLSITSMRIESHPFKEDRSTKLGFVGNVTFKIAGAIQRDLLQELNVLADFAFYASVGQKTQIGMGLVRRLT